jgi:ubiquinone/menaquinone biosynthesis C-methylase UbiE
MRGHRLVESGLVNRALPRGSRRRATVARAVRRVAPAVVEAKNKITLPRAVTPREEAKLRGVWARHSAEILDVYLVTGYQDPRLNAQSILARHALVRALFGSRFEDLMRAELAHAVELNDAIRLRAKELGVPLTATMNSERLAIVRQVMEVVADRVTVFGDRWREALAGEQAPPLRVMEFACGSANDYRAFADYGIARFLNYTGIDLSETNIANAKLRFPDVDFRVGSILSLTEPDSSVDYVIGFDILEHLSLQAMETVLATAVRIARRGLYFAFFRMDEAADHQEEPRGQYHYNLLSAPMMRRYMSERYSQVQLVHIAGMLKEQYGFPHSYEYNRRAYSLIAEGPR